MDMHTSWTGRQDIHGWLLLQVGLGVAMALNHIHAACHTAQHRTATPAGTHRPPWPACGVAGMQRKTPRGSVHRPTCMHMNLVECCHRFNGFQQHPSRLHPYTAKHPVPLQHFILQHIQRCLGALKTSEPCLQHTREAHALVVTGRPKVHGPRDVSRPTVVLAPRVQQQQRVAVHLHWSGQSQATASPLPVCGILVSVAFTGAGKGGGTSLADDAEAACSHLPIPGAFRDAAGAVVECEAAQCLLPFPQTLKAGHDACQGSLKQPNAAQLYQARAEPLPNITASKRAAESGTNLAAGGLLRPVVDDSAVGARACMQHLDTQEVRSYKGPDIRPWQVAYWTAC